jgi:hypothetical protein
MLGRMDGPSDGSAPPRPPFRLPRIERPVPRTVRTLVVVLVALVLAKVLTPPYACRSPWDGVNTFMLLAEAVLALLLAQGYPLRSRSVWDGDPTAANPAPPGGAIPPDGTPVSGPLRSFAALAGFVLMLCVIVALVLLATIGRRRGWPLAEASCGCFGPFDLPLPVHVGVAALLAGGFLRVFLREETVAADRALEAGLRRDSTAPPSDTGR